MKLSTHFLLASMAFLFLLSCSSGKEVQKEEQVQAEKPRPQWIKERPNSAGYYVGIGSASKVRNPLDYALVAKKNALNDLASEIKVSVEGESFLNVIEHDYDFQESFQSTIVTKTNEDIENYESVGNWENPNEYWVYYRLSKAEHERLKREKKQNALRSANDFFDKAIESAEKNNISQSVKLHLQALEEMKPYWNETNEFTRAGQSVFLDNEIYTSLLDLLNSLKIKSNSEEVLLSHKNDFSSEVTVTVLKNSEPLSGIPINWYFNKRTFSRPKTLTTNSSGEVSVTVDQVELKDKNNALDLKIDAQSLIAEQHSSDLAKVISDGIELDKLRLPIVVQYPITEISTDEKHFGKAASEDMLANTLQNSLAAEGFRFTNQQQNADFIIEITADTNKGGQSQGFHVAYLDFVISVKNASTGEELYRKGINQLKGLQLNFDSASTEAYKKAAKKIQEEIAGDIVSELL